MANSLQPKNPLLPSEIDLHVPVALLSFTIPANLREDYQKSVAIIDQFIENYTGKVERNDLLLKICDHVAQLGKLYSTQQFLSILGNVGEYLRILLLSSEYHHVYCSVIIQDGLVKNGDYRVHTVIGRHMNMKTLSKISRRRQLGKSKEETALGYFIADVIQAWGEAFEPRAALYPYIPETYHRLKWKHSCLFLRPDYDPTRVPIFLPEMTRQQMEEVEHLNRNSSRPSSSSFENSPTYASPPASSPYDKAKWSSSSAGDDPRYKPAKPPLPRQRSSMSPPDKPPKPPTPVRSASMHSRPKEEVDLLNSPWSAASSSQSNDLLTGPPAPVTTPVVSPTSVYDESSVQHVLAVFSTPPPTLHPTPPSSQLTPWTPLNDVSQNGPPDVSPPRSADVGFDLSGDFKPQSMHSLLEKYVSEVAFSSPSPRRTSAVSPMDTFMTDVSPTNFAPLETSFDVHEEPVATVDLDETSEIMVESEETKEHVVETRETIHVTNEHDGSGVDSDHSFTDTANDTSLSDVTHVDVAVQSDVPTENTMTEPADEAGHVVNREEQEALDTRDSKQQDLNFEMGQSTASTSSVPAHRLSKGSPVPEGPSELEKAFALRHMKESADAAPTNEAASSEGAHHHLQTGPIPPSKPKREAKKDSSYDPASDKNVEVKFFGNQRVLVRKSSAGAIPKYF